METDRQKNSLVHLLSRSKPTGWDGDTNLTSSLRILFASSSKPTVWDGDMEVSYSPPLGGSCSKPTVWDGDIITALSVSS